MKHVGLRLFTWKHVDCWVLYEVGCAENFGISRPSTGAHCKPLVHVCNTIEFFVVSDIYSFRENAHTLEL